MENKILAYVGDRVITEEDKKFFLESLGPQFRSYFESGDKSKEILNELVCQEMLYLDAKENKIDENEDFQKVVRKTTESLLKTYAVGKVLESVVVTDEEIEKYYNETSDKYNSPKSVNASHILVDSEKQADMISEKIKAGDDFAELAKEYSSCPSKNNGGNLGTFHSGQMVKEFDDAVFAMKENEISSPVKTQFGYHIIKLNEIIPEKKYSLDEIKDKVAADYKRVKEQKVYSEKLEELSTKYKVDLVEEEPGN